MATAKTPNENDPHLRQLMQERQSFYASFFTLGRISSIIIGIIVMLMLINWALG